MQFEDKVLGQFCHPTILIVIVQPSDVQGGGGGGVDATLPKVFLSFLLEDKTSAPDVFNVFSSCSFIPRAHLESSSVMVSFYGYEKLRHK